METIVMAKERALTETLPGQLDITDRLRPYLTEPVPGNENPFLHEISAASLYLDTHGREILNPTPMAPPVGYQQPISIAEQMRQMIKMASYEAAMAGAETEDEANDFDVDEDMEPHSQWEHNFDPDPELEAMVALASRTPAPAPAATPPNPPHGGSNPAPSPGAGTVQPSAASHAAKTT